MQFDELSDEAKAHAIENERQAWYGYFETRDLTEEFKWALEPLGFPTDDIAWSLSSCQGDGVAFYGDVDLAAYMKWKTPFGSTPKAYDEELEWLVSCKLVSNSNHYCHYNTMTVEVDFIDTHDDEYDYRVIINEIEAMVKDDIVSVSHALEKYGYSWLEGESSDEAIAERLANDDWWDYDEDGDRIAQTAVA